jgi:hypothetical protein
MHAPVTRGFPRQPDTSVERNSNTTSLAALSSSHAANKSDELAPLQIIEPHLPPPARAPHRILPQMAYPGQGVCGRLRRAPGDPRNARLRHFATIRRLGSRLSLLGCPLHHITIAIPRDVPRAASPLATSTDSHSKADVALRRRRLLRNKSDYFRSNHAA